MALLQDLRFALRLLSKDRSFTVTALLTLAVCIAANTAILGIVRSVVMNPLPIPDSDRLVALYNSYPNAGAPRAGSAATDLADRQREVPALAEVGVMRRETLTHGAVEGAERLNAILATVSFFQLVRMEPASGRMFTEEDGQPGQNAVVILEYGFWQSRFGGDPNLVGQTIRLDGNPFTVVGVAAEDFVFLWDDIDVFMPAAFRPEDLSSNARLNLNWTFMVGRMAAGAGIEQVRQQVVALNAANDERFPELKQILAAAGFHTEIVGLQDDLVRDIRVVLYLLWGGVLFVLLIGCVNIANLVMVRASARARELATRLAVGADLGRLTRQLLTETTVLSLAGGAVGVLLGWWTLTWVSTLNLDQLPRGYEIQLAPSSVAAVLALTVLVGLALSLAPALGLRRMNVEAELREEGRGGTGGRRAQLARRAMATAQVTIAFVLLIGAGLLFASFREILALDLGFEPAGVHTVTVSLPNTAYPDGASRTTFVSRALAAVRSIPDVETAGLTTLLPFTGNGDLTVVLGEGHVMEPGESLVAPTQGFVSEGYFETMQVPLIGGRYFDAFDSERSVRGVETAVIDERLARKFWPDRDAVGRRLYRSTSLEDVDAITEDTTFINIIGVVQEVQLSDPRADFTPVGMVYFPFAHLTGSTMSFTIRTRTQSDTLMTTVRQKLAAIDRDLPLADVRTMPEWIDRALVSRRVPMYLSLAFGIVGLFLAAVGIYGVLAYGVEQRRREIGVRMALGSSASAVFRMVLTGGLTIIGIGLTLGVAASYVVGRVMQSQLYGVAPMDLFVIGAVVAILGAVALLASVIPAWRATKINPIVVLGK